MMVDKIDDCAQENGKSFSATCRSIHKSAFSIDNMLPCFFLEGKRLMAFFIKPFLYDYMTGCILDDHGEGKDKINGRGSGNRNVMIVEKNKYISEE